jgi:hypothetical protein
MSLLDRVVLTLPTDIGFSETFEGVLKDCLEQSQDILEVKQTLNGSLPKINIQFRDTKQPVIEFIGDDFTFSRNISNETGQERTSPHTYKPITIDELKDRIHKAGNITIIDHLGVNFPWFDGLSPIIAELRNRLGSSSAYYRFPTGEDWDFILPATRHEIEAGTINLDLVRRPKLELVSFEKASTPIIQIDCITTIEYSKLKKMFPEAIADDELFNIWVYIENSYGVDICFVLNGPREKDWSNFFKGHKLKK